jgi:membrane protein implicated in regulation of membrane protease activity
MLTVYILSAIAGGILVAASALLGGDHDAHVGDTDFDDIDGHEGIHSDIYLPILSLRFWTFFAACFGITGLLLTNFSSASPVIVAVVSAVTGVIAGLSTFAIMRRMRDMDSDSGVKEEHLIGREGRVLVGLSPGREGKIRVDVKGELVDMTAFTEDDAPLTPGDRALVVSIDNGRANVVSYTAIIEEQT